MEIENVWVIDPLSRDVFRLTGTERRLVEDRILTAAGTPIRVDLNQVFANIDAAAKLDEAE